MPEHLRALVVILGLATVVFAFAKTPACALASTTGDFERRRNLWFAITLTAFLAQDFWIYVIVTATLLLFALPREPNKLAMFFVLLFAVPLFRGQVPGFGILNHAFEIHYVRLLALVVLLPTFLILRKQGDTERFGRLLPDKLIASYLILDFLLQLTHNTFTNTLRHGIFYNFIDVFLPYYVASRSLKTIRAFRDALMGFVIAALVLSAIGAFEFARHWLLYSGLRDVLAPTHWNYGNYLERGTGSGLLRALGPTGDPIAFGYVIAVAIGFFLFIRKSVPNTLIWGLCLALLIAGLISPLSRGPWVGAIAILLVFVAIGPNPARGLATLGLLGVIVFSVLLISPAGEKVVDLLPFVGTVEAHNITYRQRFIEGSIQVIIQNPFFGARDFANAQEMDAVKDGTFIDTLNVFLTVGLRGGLVSMSLFAGFFIAAAVGIFRSMRQLADSSGDLHQLGQALFATLLGIMLMISTVSGVSVIPVIYWSVAGLGVAYASMLAREKFPAKTPGTVGRSGFQAMTMKNG